MIKKSIKLYLFIIALLFIRCSKDEPFCDTCTYRCYMVTYTRERLESGKDTSYTSNGKSIYINPKSEQDFYQMIMDSSKLIYDSRIRIEKTYVCQQ